MDNLAKQLEDSENKKAVAKTAAETLDALNKTIRDKKTESEKDVKESK